jgi:hypothetical protein
MLACCRRSTTYWRWDRNRPSVERVASDGDAEEVLEVAEVSHGELRTEFGHDVLKKSRRRSSEDDVVDLQQVGDLCTLLVNKEGGVRGRGDEAELTKKRGELLVPHPRSLLEPVQGLLE